MGAGTRPQALLVDDGELNDVRALFRDLEIQYEEAKGGGEDPGLPSRLLVTIPRHAMALERVRQERAPASRPLHLVVAREPTRTLRGALERSTCDIVVSHPIHPEALRVLIVRALFRGENLRRQKRVVMGAPVKLKGGGRAGAAMLTQLSLRGCGLTSERAYELGRPVEVTLSKKLTGGRPVALGGRVVGTPAGRGNGARRELAVCFEVLSPAVKKQLRAIMEEHGLADVTGAPGAETASARGVSARAASTAQGGGGRSSRRTFTRQVMAGSAGVTATLIGVDLSEKGIRVKPEPGFEVGDLFKLVLYGSAGLKPTIVKAVLARDYGDAGLFLRFVEVSAALAAKLGKLMGTLPEVHTRKGGADRPGVIVSRVIERSRKS